ncbi:MAG: class I SAM-dependent methyltransferase [Pseudomonadota bacterium]
MSETGARPKRSAEERAHRAERKAERAANKAKVRDTFLKRLNRGGVAVEIGVWHGEFSEKILELIAPEKLYLIDPWANVTEDSHSEAFVGRTENAKMERIFKAVQKKFASEVREGRVEIIRDWSTLALNRFEPGSIDFAYVDGDHSYDGVCADLEALFPKMRVSGVMAFDDYHRRGWWGDGVVRAINEFLGRYPDQLRIRAIAGAQLAIEKMEPLKSSG